MLWFSCPGQVLGSWVANWVLTIRLVQWLGWIFENKERQKEIKVLAVWRQNTPQKKDQGKSATQVDIFPGCLLRAQGRKQSLNFWGLYQQINKQTSKFSVESTYKAFHRIRCCWKNFFSIYFSVKCYSLNKFKNLKFHKAPKIQPERALYLRLIVFDTTGTGKPRMGHPQWKGHLFVSWSLKE